MRRAELSPAERTKNFSAGLCLLAKFIPETMCLRWALSVDVVVSEREGRWVR